VDRGGLEGIEIRKSNRTQLCRRGKNLRRVQRCCRLRAAQTLGETNVATHLTAGIRQSSTSHRHPPTKGPARAIGCYFDSCSSASPINTRVRFQTARCVIFSSSDGGFDMPKARCVQLRTSQLDIHIPILPFGKRLETDLPGCCGCCCPPKPPGIPRIVCGTPPAIGDSSATKLQLCIPPSIIQGRPSTQLRSCALPYASNRSVGFLSEAVHVPEEEKAFCALRTSLVAGEASRDRLRLVDTEAKSPVASRGSSLRGDRSLTASTYGQLTARIESLRRRKRGISGRKGRGKSYLAYSLLQRFAAHCWSSIAGSARRSFQSKSKYVAFRVSRRVCRCLGAVPCSM
jgi:hypothetical protein